MRKPLILTTCLVLAVVLTVPHLSLPNSEGTIRVFSGLAYGDSIASAASTGDSIFVPGNFSTIQGAVDAANFGDTIYVAPGNYSEHVIIRKDNVKLLGHGYSDTKVIGNATGEGIKVEAANVTVSGFMVMNFAYGILADKATNCSISDNYVTNNKFGIWISYSSNSLVSKNKAIDNEHNLRLSSSTNNTLIQNIMQGKHSYNFGLFGSSLAHYIQAIDASNIANGKPVYYIANAQDLTIDPRSYPDIGGLIVVNSSRITIKDLAVSNNLDGVLFAYVSSSTIKNFTAIENKIGIELFESNNCGVFDSLVKYNMYHGLLLSASYQVMVAGNNVTSNEDGIYVSSSNSSSIQNNNVRDNTIGLKLYRAVDNTFFHNNLVENQRQTDIYNSQKNVFDNGVEGNYWSNYTGSDDNNDAIGDTRLPHEQLDNHPLMGMYYQFSVKKGGTDYATEAISNSIIDGFQLNQLRETLTFDVLTENEVGFIRLTTPKTLVLNNSVVTLNNSQIIFQSEKSNETHTTMYFVYPSGSYKVEIGSSKTPMLTAEAGSNQKTVLNRSVLFDGSGSNSSMGIESYRWDFGDGSTGTGVTTNHAYTRIGNYTVTLEVTDATGNRASDSLTVIVEHEPQSATTDTLGWWIISTAIVDVAAATVVAAILVRHTINLRRANKKTK